MPEESESVKSSPLLMEHVRSWLKVHPEVRIGLSGDWELPTIEHTCSAARGSIGCRACARGLPDTRDEGAAKRADAMRAVPAELLSAKTRTWAKLLPEHCQEPATMVADGIAALEAQLTTAEAAHSSCEESRRYRTVLELLERYMRMDLFPSTDPALEALANELVEVAGLGDSPTRYERLVSIAQRALGDR